MKKRLQSNKMRKLLEDCASVNECTGLFQHVALDPDEVENFHKMYNELDGKDSIHE